MCSSPAGGKRSTEVIHWSRATLGGTGSGDEEGSPSLADSEETPRSGVQTCNDPLRGICCKARCRTAEETQKVTKERGIPCDGMKFGGKTEEPPLGRWSPVCGY